MKRSRFKPLVFPAALLAIGVLGGWGADFAVGRWQDYGLYGLSRPVADVLVVVGVVWLVVAAVGAARGKRG
ncbi:MAG: hypothetical protein ACK4VY_12265 [Brevundimonas sp.]